MFRTPSTYGYSTATCNPIKPFTIALSGTYTGRMYVRHFAVDDLTEDRSVHTPDFFDLNLRLSYDFKIWNEIGLQTNIGIQNLFNSYQSDFDKGANRDSGYIYGPGSPRSFFAGIKISY